MLPLLPACVSDPTLCSSFGSFPLKTEELCIQVIAKKLYFAWCIPPTPCPPLPCLVALGCSPPLQSREGLEL